MSGTETGYAATRPAVFAPTDEGSGSKGLSSRVQGLGSRGQCAVYGTRLAHGATAWSFTVLPCGGTELLYGASMVEKAQLERIAVHDQ
eukprot:943990-Rhodomonas_salina.1